MSAPGSLRKKASRAEASSTASAMILPLGFLAAVADQLLGEQDIGWGDVGEIRLCVADHGVEGGAGRCPTILLERAQDANEERQRQSIA